VTESFAAFLVRRLLAAIAFVALVSIGALALAHLAPGDATTELSLSHVDKATIAQTRARLGLDRPFSAQLGSWLVGLTHFDLGISSEFGRPVAGLVTERAAKTAWLAATALALATVIGLPLGLLTGARPRGLLARVVAPISIALVACPPLVGALALLLLAVGTGWLSVSPGAVAVPALALGFPLAAMLERLQSQATAEVLLAPDLMATAARGVSPARLLWLHAGRQSLRPVLGIYGIVIGSLFSGSLAVEFVTGWPGLGRLMYDALVGRDLFLVTGCALLGAVCLALGNLVADLIRALVDPRVRERT
jgi:peptide/nickel transport system permease protein